jgi:hypothetical protein
LCSKIIRPMVLLIMQEGKRIMTEDLVSMTGLQELIEMTVIIIEGTINLQKVNTMTAIMERGRVKRPLLRS